MIESPEALYHVPFLLRWLCYLAGMALYSSTLYWLVRVTRDPHYNLSLRATSGAWLCRIIAACAVASLGRMAFTGELLRAPQKGAAEVAILLLLTALFLMTAKKRFLNQIHVLNKRLPLETIKVVLVSVVCLGGLMLLFSLWHFIFYFVTQPVWVPTFVLGALMIVPLALIFPHAQRAEMTESLRFYHLLLPILLACALFMLPDLIDYLGNSEKFMEFLQGGARLQKA